MQQTIITQYGDLHQFLAHIEASRYKWDGDVRGARAGWSKNPLEGCRYIRNGGDPAEQAAVQAVLNKIDSSLHGRTRPEIRAHVSGQRVCVPDALQGNPRAMRRRVQVANDRSPVRVYVETAVSAGVDAGTIIKRGACVAAFIMALSEERPVELWAGSAGEILRRGQQSGSHTTVLTKVKINTAPVSISELASVLVSRHFARGICFTDVMDAVKRGPHDYSRLSWGWGIHDADARTARIRKEMGWSESDVIIPGGHLFEHSEMCSDPIAWINRHLAAQRDID